MSRRWPRILIVDDEPMVLSFFRNFLEKNFERRLTYDNQEHYGEVIGALGGKMALRLLKEEGPFDLVLTDLFMNDLSGIDLLTLIRTGGTENISNGTRKDILVGGWSGGGFTDYSAQFDFYLDKGFDLTPDLVARVILKALDQRHGTSMLEGAYGKFLRTES